jgi:protein-S-isoprenylcysteine O-methyltransferase Ste14
MQRNKMLPPTYLLIALVAMVAFHFLLPVAQAIASPWNLFGVFPLVLGIVVNMIADNLFHTVKTTVKPGEESTVLVTNGPFRFTRNPMYLGFVLILAGVAIVLGSLTPFVVIPVFAVLMDRLFIRMEEQMLATRFGSAWQTYTRRTRRWI